MTFNSKKPDLARIKREVSFLALIERYNLQLKAQGGDSFRGKCPLPTHTNEKDGNSFTATRKDSGWVWDCFSTSCIANRGGKKGGNVLEFVMLMESDTSLFRIGTKLNEWFNLAAWVDGSNGVPLQPKTDGRASASPTQLSKGVKTSATSAPTGANATETLENKPLSFRLQHIDFDHPYLATRRIARQTAELFGVGHFPGRSKLLHGRIVFPIWNPRGEGNPVAYAGRSIDDSEPKYIFPPEFKKSLELFNLHRIPDTADSVIVLEGFFSVMRFHQAGIQNAVSLMGNSVSEAQIAVLSTFSRIALCLDPDEAGRQATAALLPKLARHTYVRVLEPLGQPDELEDEAIRRLCQ